MLANCHVPNGSISCPPTHAIGRQWGALLCLLNAAHARAALQLLQQQGLGRLGGEQAQSFLCTIDHWFPAA